MEEPNARKTGLDALASVVEASSRPAGDQLGPRAMCEALGWPFDGMMGARSLVEALGHALDEAEAEGERIGRELAARGESYDNYEVDGLRTIQRTMAQTAERYPANPLDVVSAVGGDRGLPVGRALCNVIAPSVRAAKSRRDEALARLLPQTGPVSASEAGAVVAGPADDSQAQPVAPRTDEQMTRTSTVTEAPVDSPTVAPHPTDADGNALAIGDEIVAEGRRSRVELVGLTRVAFYDRGGSLKVAEGGEVHKLSADTEQGVESDARLTVADYASRRGVEASEYAVRRDLMDRWAALRAPSTTA